MPKADHLEYDRTDYKHALEINPEAIALFRQESKRLRAWITASLQFIAYLASRVG